MIPAFEAILFDLDGTLVDTSEVVRRILDAWCARYGIPLAAVLEGCGGERTEDTVARVAPHLCAKSEAAALDRLEGSSLDGLRPVSGADAFLATLSPDTWAVVTSSSRLTAGPKLTACALPVPRIMVCAESVTQGKPHPEPFLTGAAELGLPPAACLVFEDADNGVRSALAAGCHVVVVGSQCTLEHDRILGFISSYADLQWSPEGVLQLQGRGIATLNPRAS